PVHLGGKHSHRRHRSGGIHHRYHHPAIRSLEHTAGRAAAPVLETGCHHRRRFVWLRSIPLSSSCSSACVTANTASPLSGQRKLEASSFLLNRHNPPLS